MISNRAKIALFASALLCSFGAAGDPPAGYAFLPFDEARARAASGNKPVFVYFGREGCGFCDVTNKKAFSKPEVRKAYQAHYALAYLDAEGGKRITVPGGERITEAEYGTRLRAFVTPVFLFLAPDGKELLRRVGIQSGEDLLDADRYIQEGHYQTMSYDEFAKRRAVRNPGG